MLRLSRLTFVLYTLLWIAALRIQQLYLTPPAADTTTPTQPAAVCPNVDAAVSPAPLQPLWSVSPSSSSSPNSSRFVVSWFFTPEYREQSDRLQASCERFKLEWRKLEMPTFAKIKSHKHVYLAQKPLFIMHRLKELGVGVLFMDSDLIFKRPPMLLQPAHSQDFDMMTVSWNKHTRYYVHSSSGLMFFNNTVQARRVLQAWRRALIWDNNVHAADDQVFDWTMNYYEALTGVRTKWFPDTYVEVRPHFASDENTVVYHPEKSTSIPIQSVSIPPLWWLATAEFQFNQYAIGHRCNHCALPMGSVKDCDAPKPMYRDDPRWPESMWDLNDATLNPAWRAAFVRQAEDRRDGSRREISLDCKSVVLWVKHWFPTVTERVRMRVLLPKEAPNPTVHVLTERHLGCYFDAIDNRDMKETFAVYREYSAPPSCCEFCAESRFCGVQAEWECWCGHSYGRLGLAATRNRQCNVTCKGDPSRTCGGANANDIYERVPVEAPINWTDDPADPRASDRMRVSEAVVDLPSLALGTRRQYVFSVSQRAPDRTGRILLFEPVNVPSDDTALLDVW
eukprot:TRINITY_DN18315_c0_g2_i1.p1 TRINITY_DN18315_c0_g2~~TRINITY_DN18315_c0_g2_i1.p1  ORF type:complete len:565 (-),score=117.11 TRINITY_DN18315_c0_g2_i1:753-2447(-)